MEHTIPRECDFTDDEITQIKNWNRAHDKRCPFLKKHKDTYTSEFSPYGTIGGGRTYSFTPTSIGTIMSVRCACGEEFLIDNNL